MDYIKNICEKLISAVLCIVSVIGLAMGISRLSNVKNIAVIGSADGPTALYVASKKPLQSILKSIASWAVVVASAAMILLTLVKRYSGEESK